MGQRTLFTIGHSTHPWKAFVTLLQAWQIQVLVDVRSVPRSRAFPWFSQERMARPLAKVGISYLPIAALGGLRHAKKESVNRGWHNASFRGYADYMQTAAFAGGLKELNLLRKKCRVCIMCAEAVWWRCHRRLIADAEVARGIPVQHIMGRKLVTRHELTDFAVVKKQRGHAPIVTYPEST